MRPPTFAPVLSCTARTAIVGTALLLISVHSALPVCAEGRTVGSRASDAGADVPQPAILKAVVAARWRLSRASAALPAVQLVHNERLEIQDFIHYVFDGGALRLCVSPGRTGGDIFAVLVDTRASRYRDFARLASTEHYASYRDGAYVVVVPLRRVSQELFDKLKSQLWTQGDLQQHLGAPSYNWHRHGIGYVGVTYVPEGLSFIGDQRSPHAPVTFQVSAPDVEAAWRQQHDYSLPPLELLKPLDYATQQRACRDEFAHELFRQREQIDQALEKGRRSPDERFVVGHINLGGLANTEEVVIREMGKPERRYSASHFTYDNDYLWLDARTVMFMVKSVFLEFYTLDARTGVKALVATVPWEYPFEDRQRVVGFGASGPKRFWYKTADGETHEATVQGR